MALNDFRGDPRGSARSRRAAHRAKIGPKKISASQITAESIAPDANGILQIGTFSGEIAAVDDGSTVIGLPALAAQEVRSFVMGDDCILVHDDASFILPGGSSIASVAGDVAAFYSLGEGNWRCFQYTRGGAPSVPAYAIAPAKTVVYQTIQSLGIGTINVNYTYSNGTDGIGATITFLATGVQTIGGVQILLGDSIIMAFVSGASDQFVPGLYDCTVEGAVGVAAVWTRSLAADTGNKFPGLIMTTLDTRLPEIWFCLNTTDPVVGTDFIDIIAIRPTQISSALMSGWTVNNVVLTTYTLVYTDAFCIVTLNNAGSVTVTIPTKATAQSSSDITVPWDGIEIIVVGIGAGLVTLAAAAGVTISKPTNESLTLAKDHVVRLVSLGSNVWEIQYGSRPPDGASIDINASGQHRRMALTGDVTAPTGSGVTTLVTVTEAKGGTGQVTFPSMGVQWGLVLSNDGSDATNDIDIAVGCAVDSTRASVMTLGSALIKRLDAAWAVGTNQGGLDTGAIANGVYHLWLIKRSDTGVVDVLFSASATAPTMPTSYDRKCRIGSIIRASAAILAFTQYEDDFWLSTPILDIDATNPGTSAVTRTLTLPTGIKVMALLNLTINTVGSALNAYLSSLDLTDSQASFTAAPLSTLRGAATATATGVVLVRTNTSAQIRSRIDTSGGGQVIRIATLGWLDPRGRF